MGVLKGSTGLVSWPQHVLHLAISTWSEATKEGTLTGKSRFGAVETELESAKAHYPLIDSRCDGQPVRRLKNRLRPREDRSGHVV